MLFCWPFERKFHQTHLKTYKWICLLIMAAWMLYTLKLPARFRQAAQYQNKWSSYSPFQFEVHPFSSFSSWPTQLASCFILRESPSNHLWARAKLAGLFNTCCWLGKQPAMNWSRQQLPGITQKNFNWKHIIPHHTIKSQGPDQHVCCVSCSVFSINMAKFDELRPILRSNTPPGQFETCTLL